MSNKYFDVLVAKEYETKQNGMPEKKVVWNKVGRAWTSRAADSLNFELFILPNQRYVISMRERPPVQDFGSFNPEEVAL